MRKFSNIISKTTLAFRKKEKALLQIEISVTAPFCVRNPMNVENNLFRVRFCRFCGKLHALKQAFSHSLKK
ncbi:MAG: hypothetical protein R3Y06_08545, partial [Faecalibacterium sp.]